MLALGGYLFFASLILGYIAVAILSRHLAELRAVTRVLPHPAKHSITEAFFSETGRITGKAAVHAGNIGSRILLAVLSKFLPWFRDFSRSSVMRLERLNNMIKGKQELKERRDPASAFIRDIRENAENGESGKIEG